MTGKTSNSDLNALGESDTDVQPVSNRKLNSLRRGLCLSMLSVLLLAVQYYFLGIRGIQWSFIPTEASQLLSPNENSTACPQSNPLFPKENEDIDLDLDRLYATETFKADVVRILGGAIQIRTESFDDLKPVGEDSRWHVFEDMKTYLEDSFGLLYETVSVTTVNTYGLVYHWQGSDSSLKPILLTAHQDVVPVESNTLDQWLHPPYSGHYDGTWIWGRGSADDKSTLIAELTALESLAKRGFKPKRSVVLAFGMDEEAAGVQGAGQIATFLEERYGKHGFAMLVDEGGENEELFGGAILFATPAIAEKGYLDVGIKVLSPGGHSSTPPDHTSIGFLSQIVVEIENHPHKPMLSRDGASFAALKCAAAYGPSFPDELRDIILGAEAEGNEKMMAKLRDQLILFSPHYVSELGTTQAVDIIRGGVKVNSLPNVAFAVVSHRIAEHSSTSELRRHISDVVEPVARILNLEMNAFGSELKTSSEMANGRVVLSVKPSSALEPSPVSPIYMASPFHVLSGTIKATLESSENYQPVGVVVSPTLELGNTDTKFYWNLTEHIFRYTHRSSIDVYNGFHTVNEAIRADSVVEEVRFFTKLILNSDEASWF